MNILFICSFNKYRSLTAEHIFRNTPYAKIRSAGTSSKARKTVTKRDLEWADKIYVMEREHKEILTDRFPTQMLGKLCVILDIPDIYPYMDPELVSVLKESVGDFTI